MNAAAQLDPFFKNTDLTPEQVRHIVQDGLVGADFGELFQQVSFQESLTKNMGKYVSMGSAATEGFGFRVGQGERTGYVYSPLFNEASLNEAVSQARKVLNGSSGVAALQGSYGAVAAQLYPAPQVAAGFGLAEKVRKIDEIEFYMRSLDSNIVNVSILYAFGRKNVHIVTPNGQDLVDALPMTILRMEVTVKNASGENETGYFTLGGRVNPDHVFNDANWQDGAKKALAMAQALLVAKKAPAGTMDVVLNHGWPAVILHEAVGHGLEGDFNRKGTSVYTKEMGKKVAASIVTVVDQGDMPGERGSLHFDDEGTPTQENVLIENGKLVKYMQDIKNARLMGVEPTGNGRRENYKFEPMPRMTNTYFRPGVHTPEEIVSSVKDGIYIAEMSGGSVDITSGQFNMRATLSYRIRDGKLEEPLKGVTLIGDGLKVIQSVAMVGNDLDLARTSGTCGKNGQGVPVGIGQPTIRVNGMTVGGAG